MLLIPEFNMIVKTTILEDLLLSLILCFYFEAFRPIIRS